MFKSSVQKWFAFFAFALVAVQLVADEPKPRLFPHPDRIRFDRQCFTIDGKDTFIFSGSFHYFRCPKELWPERFAKIKAAGFNCVDMYIPWNVHEQEAPKSLDDFSHVDLRDLEEWLNMAETNGLYVIARPGPFICAEWERGGFPGWLITKRPAGYKGASWFRSDDPEFLAWSQHWYRAVLPALARHQITRKKPGQAGVILVFLENEYDHYFKDTAQGEVIIKVLAQEALAQGIDVPLVTCETDFVSGNEDPILRHVFNVQNCYPGWKVDKLAGPLAEQHRRQPDAPLMIGELQGGWFSFDWDVPPLRPNEDYYQDERSPAQINNLTLFALQNGVTALNYYMLYGGTNPGDRTAKDIATSYDFNAAIRECGGVGEKYARVTAIGRLLREHGEELARSRIIEARVTTDQQDVTVVMRQSTDGARFLFIRTAQHDQPRNGTAHVQPLGGKEIVFSYELEPFGSKIFYLPAAASDASQGQWLPESVPAAARPATLPKPVEIQRCLYREDGGPVSWKKMRSGESLNELGVYDNRFVYYRADFSLSAAAEAANPAELQARITFPTLTGGSRVAGEGTCDRVLATVNGQWVGEARGVCGDIALLVQDLKTGKNEIELLYENSGCAKEDIWMEKTAGVREIYLLPAGPVDEVIRGWKMQKVRPPESAETIRTVAAGQEGEWQEVSIDEPVANQLSYHEAAVFRTRLNLTAQDIRNGRTGLFISQMGDDGWVFLNGRKIGENHRKIESCIFDLSKAARVGSNSLAIVVSDTDWLGHGGLGLAKLTWSEKAAVSSDVKLQYSDCPAGLAEGWYRAGLDEKGWQTCSLPAHASSSQALMMWHRLHFQLPATAADVWVPWLVRLQATGDGFIYLNGHLIGRYSEAGGQHDYYLPECWLNSGADADNVIALCLCPRSTGASVQSVSIMPYTVYAESR